MQLTPGQALDLVLGGLGASAIGAMWLVDFTLVDAVSALGDAAPNPLASVVPWLATAGAAGCWALAIRYRGETGHWLRGAAALIGITALVFQLWAGFEPLFRLSELSP
ncbi:MAG: hypothetical protein ABMA64_42745 [Myxococcota bacterium]